MEKKEKSEKVKNVVLAAVIATVFLVTAIGSVSAIDGCVKIGGNSDDPDDVFTCGDTVTESCAFSGYMNCSETGDCGLTVGADDIVIDGAGYELTGNAKNWLAGIYNLDKSGTVVKNLIVSDFSSYGIYFSGKPNDFDSSTIDHVIENCVIENCTVHKIGTTTQYGAQGMFLKGMSNSEIKGNDVYGVKAFNEDSCESGGNGIFFYGGRKAGGPASQHNNITCNWLHDSQKAGFFTKMMLSNSTISHNNASGNSWSGILDKPGGIVMRCKKTDNNVVEHNTLSNNYGDGLNVGGCNNIIKYNTIVSNSDLGIDMGRSDGSDYNELYHNTVCDNGAADIVTCGPECYGNHGDDNTCNTTLNYDDDGTSGCTFACGVEEGACVGATQCFTCGDTVTESCTLNVDMSCPVGEHGLIIGADDITIDGNNYCIDGGSPSCDPFTYPSGIYDNGGYDRVTIRNLEILHFCNGICFDDDGINEYYIIQNCIIHDTDTSGDEGSLHGINLRIANHGTVKGCEIYNASGTGSGCESGGDGIFLLGSPGIHGYGRNNTFTGNNIHHNRKGGIFIKGSPDYNTISYNNLWENGQLDAGEVGGVILRCKQCKNNTIENNHVYNNTGSGVYLGGPENTVRNNIVMSNKNEGSINGIGIRLQRCNEWAAGEGNNTLYNNTICENEYGDIDVVDACIGHVHGDCNTCNTISNYNDTGTTGCTFICPGETDLTITTKYEQWFGEVYNVIYTITNLGHSTAPESTTGIHIDDIPAKTDPVGLIGPGESCIRTVGPFTMSGSEDTIEVRADEEDVIDETDEDNNCLENVFTNVVMPDLVITEKSEAWISLEDKTYNVTYTVKNIGNADANESTTSIIIDGVENAADSVGVLAPQETHTAELGPFTISGESDTIGVCADNESDVTESNEDNNYLQNTFEHPGVPDLVITKKFEEWVVSAGPYNEYNITYTIRNIGTGDAGTSTTSITIDGEEVATDTAGALAEGDSYTNTLGPFTMTGDSDTIKVCADSNNDVEESNEDNNCTENTFEYSEVGCLADDNTLFRCGNTVTRNCTFNGDMSCPFTHGLEIGADNITLNGNNSVLDGVMCTLDALSRSGIYNHGYDDVTIQNIEVKGFCSGMYLARSGVSGDVYRNIIEQCDIHHNGNASSNAGFHGISMKYVYNSTIRNNSIHHQIAGVNPNPGCEDGGNGMFQYKGDYNNITENRFYNNTKAGMLIKMMPKYWNISHNQFWDNGQGGIILRCKLCDFNLIEHNNASDNYGSGIFIGGNSNTIRNNTVCDNRDSGPYYQDSVDGHGYGIHLGRSDGSLNNYLHDNEICGNDYKDIYVVSGVTGNHGVNNTCDTTYNYDDDGSTNCMYSCVQQGVCGDVDGLPGVTTNDGRQIFMYLLYGEEQYPLADLWAADCDGLCDGITTNDGRQIFMNLLYGEEEYPLVCC